MRPPPIPYDKMIARKPRTWGEFLKLSEAEQRDRMRQLVDYWARVAGMLDAQKYDADGLEEQQNNGEIPL